MPFSERLHLSNLDKLKQRPHFKSPTEAIYFQCIYIIAGLQLNQGHQFDTNGPLTTIVGGAVGGVIGFMTGIGTEKHLTHHIPQSDWDYYQNRHQLLNTATDTIIVTSSIGMITGAILSNALKNAHII